MTARVLVLEDERVMLEMLHDLLYMEGFECVPVSDPGRALEVAQSARPDCFLIDIMLPHVSGIEVADELRSCGFETTPMIAMSASRVMRDLAEATGIFALTIDKPFDMGHLAESVQHVITGLTRRSPPTARGSWAR